MVFDPNVFDSDVFDAGDATNAPAGLASGTGSAFGASILVAVNAGLASGTGSAYDATISSGINAAAGLATGTGTAGGAQGYVALNAGSGAGTGQANDAAGAAGAARVFDPAVFDFNVFDTDDSPATSAQAGAATGTGSAGATSTSIAPTSSAGAGTGTAYDATVSLATSVSVNAGAATGTGAAGSASISIAPHAGFPWGSGDALDTTKPRAYPAGASGTGAAYPALVLTFASVPAVPVADPNPINVQILYESVDIAGDVIRQSARFTAAANGRVGTCQFRVRDDGHTYAFVLGKHITLVINDLTVWFGYIASVRRGYWFTDGGDPGDRERYFEIQGVDLNVLFQRRYIYDKDTPENVELTTFPTGTHDDVIVKYYKEHHADLNGITTDLVEHVGTPSTDVELSGNVGWTFGDFMNYVIRNTGALYYIDPDRNLVLTDVDTPNAPFEISDQPGSASGTVPATISDPFTRVTAVGWGTGALGTWTTAGGTTVSTDGDEAVSAGSAFMYQTVPFPSDVDASPQWTFETRFLLPSSGSTSVGMEAYGGLDETGIGFAVYFDENSATADEMYINYDNFNVAGTPATVTFTRGEFGRMKVELDQTTGHIRAKVWSEDNAEPGWIVEEDDPALILPHVPMTDLAIARDSSSSTTARWDYVTFDYETVVEGDPRVGYRELEIEYDGSNLRNDALVWGAGQGSAVPVFKRTENATSIASHGRWQVGEFNQSVWRQSTVNRMSASFVYGSPQSRRGGKDDGIAVRCKVFEPGLRVGYKVRVISEVFNFDEVLPIRAMEVDFVTASQPVYNLTLSHEIDPPWTNFEFWIPSFDFPGFGGFLLPDLNLVFPPFPPLNFLPSWPPFDGCAEAVECVVIDSFDRTDQTPFGTTDSGHIWDTPVGTTATRDTSILSNEGLLHDEPGWASATDVQGAAIGLDLDGEGELFVPITITYRMRYTGTWTSSYVYNRVPDDFADPDDTYWTPGRTADPESRSSSAGAYFNGFIITTDPHVRNQLAVYTRRSIPINRFTIYNAAGALYVSHFSPGSVAGVSSFPVLVSSMLQEDTWLNVKVHLDSDQAYIRLWKEGAPEPSFWHDQVLATGVTWEDALFELHSGATTNDAVQPPFQLFIEDLCIGRSTDVGTLMGIFTGGSGLWTETFTRIDDPTGWGTSEIKGISWTTSAAFTVDDNKGRVDISPAGTLVSGSLFVEFDSLPVDISWDFEVESLPTVASANFGFAINNDGTRTSGPFVSFDVQTDGDVTGDIRNSTGTVVSFGTTVTIVPGTIVHARFRVESTQVRAKAWTTGVEPATWDRTISSGSFTPTYLVPVGQNSAISVVGTDVLVDNITINEGITDPPDTNPCGTEEEPDPDAPDDGAYCESPPTEDGYTYHTTSAFMPNSERVYVQGLLIRRTTDYTAVPALGEVTIDTALIDGLTGDPEVQVCFEAWGLPEIS